MKKTVFAKDIPVLGITVPVDAYQRIIKKFDTPFLLKNWFTGILEPSLLIYIIWLLSYFAFVRIDENLAQQNNVNALFVTLLSLPLSILAYTNIRRAYKSETQEKHFFFARGKLLHAISLVFIVMLPLYLSIVMSSTLFFINLAMIIYQSLICYAYAGKHVDFKEEQQEDKYEIKFHMVLQILSPILLVSLSPMVTSLSLNLTFGCWVLANIITYLLIPHIINSILISFIHYKHYRSTM